VICVAGGRERSETIRNALTAIDKYRPEIVAIHDAVRPFVPVELITEVVRNARLEGAAIVAQRASDTIKEVEDGFVHQTLDRRRIYRAQTPQAFRYELLCHANEEALAAGLDPESVTDDAMLVERLGVRVAVIEGPATNFKITTSEDLAFARSILEQTAKLDTSNHV
jgi:2-C-methyl-D-erythritol 4-phosphate cytidylyltransferase